MLVIFNQSGSLLNIDYQNDSFSQGDNNVHTIDVIVDEKGFKNGRYNCYIQFLREGETEPSPKLIMSNKVIYYNDTRHSGFSFQMASEWYTAIAGTLKATIELKQYNTDGVESNKAYGVVNIPINESVSSDTDTTITDEEYVSLVNLINSKVSKTGDEEITGAKSFENISSDYIGANEVEVGEITFIDQNGIATNNISTDNLNVSEIISTNRVEVETNRITKDGFYANEITVGDNDEVLINENGIATNGSINSNKVNTTDIIVNNGVGEVNIKGRNIILDDNIRNEKFILSSNVLSFSNDLTIKSLSRPKWQEGSIGEEHQLATLDDIADLVNSAPETLDTLGELAEAFSENKDIVDALNESIVKKADKTELPTKVSELENDSEYISSNQETQPTWNGKELLIMDDLYTRKEIANIPDGSDLNTIKYLVPGIYSSNGTNVANRAGTGPFIMEVFSYGLPPNDDEASETWVYRLRKLTDLQGNSYVQSCNSGGLPGVFVYGEWRSESSSGTGTSSEPIFPEYDEENDYVFINNVNGDRQELEQELSQWFDITMSSTDEVHFSNTNGRNKIIMLNYSTNDPFRESSIFKFIMGDNKIFFPNYTDIYGSSIVLEFNTGEDVRSGPTSVIINHYEVASELTATDMYIDELGVGEGKATIYIGGDYIPQSTLIYYDKVKQCICIDYCIYTEV